MPWRTKRASASQWTEPKSAGGRTRIGSPPRIIPGSSSADTDRAGEFARLSAIVWVVKQSEYYTGKGSTGLDIIPFASLYLSLYCVSTDTVRPEIAHLGVPDGPVPIVA